MVPLGRNIMEKMGEPGRKQAAHPVPIDQIERTAKQNLTLGQNGIIVGKGHAPGPLARTTPSALFADCGTGSIPDIYG
ncbi:hypothetical protein FHS31_000515 [Sphingomonas vulcanisoli]|uniref:Uncharacterized protein n=1 Tax=Sphingomonas vulcanisoli TaxID=1658060 RepID=A0ABX0TP95_9SPHN|nr:hypothetical protein [Sphingomonas vulcanisoli]NIJ06933.1 hypothetical protein [Sphingomonas vulcanisoli]